MWSDGQAFAQVATELVFEPYASKTFTLIWPGTLADGTHLGAGRYQARGALVYPGFEDDPLAAERHGVAARAVRGALIIRGLPAPWRVCASYRWRRSRKQEPTVKFSHSLAALGLAAALALPSGEPPPTPN